jgi:RNA polymerase sigma-70 factor, ECF subfamily
LKEKSPVPASETQLIHQAQRGDSEAFGALITLHERFVYNLALRTLGNPQDAQDIAQDAFLRAWTSLGSFRAESQFRTWLYRIVLNLCLNRIPHLRRELAQLADEEAADSPLPDSRAADPLSTLEAVERRKFLHRAIDRLPEQYRLLIILRYHGDLAYDEIASLLNLPLGTVKTGLFRARERLRAALSVYEEQPV